MIGLFQYFTIVILQGLIYNARDGGHLGKRIRNFRKRRSSPEKSKVLLPEKLNTIEEDLLFLKTTVLNESTMFLIKDKLIKTAAHRIKMMQSPKMEYIEHFPFFYTNPEMVMIMFVCLFHLFFKFIFRFRFCSTTNKYIRMHHRTHLSINGQNMLSV